MEKETSVGKALTLAVAGLAIYIGYKNYKKEGFWTGVGVLIMLGVSIKTYSLKIWTPWVVIFMLFVPIQMKKDTKLQMSELNP